MNNKLTKILRYILWKKLTIRCFSFGSMFTKIWRVHRIATHTKTKGQADKIKVLAAFIFQIRALELYWGSLR